MDDVDIYKIYLLDKIIRSQTSWSKFKTYYLSDILPRIVKGDIPQNKLWVDVSALEVIVSELRSRLTTSEMYQLPKMVEQLLPGGSQSYLRSHPKVLELIKQEEALLLRATKKEALIERMKSIMISNISTVDECFRNDADNELLSDIEYEQLKTPFLIENQQKLKQELIERLKSVLCSDYLAADDCLKNDPDRGLLSDDEYQQLKVSFIKEQERLKKEKQPNIACLTTNATEPQELSDFGVKKDIHSIFSEAENKILQTMMEVLTRNFEKSAVDSLYREFLEELALGGKK